MLSWRLQARRHINWIISLINIQLPIFSEQWITLKGRRNTAQWTALLKGPDLEGLLQGRDGGLSYNCRGVNWLWGRSVTERKFVGQMMECGAVKVKATQSCLTLLWAHGLHSSWNSPGRNTGVGSLSLLQGIFPTQGSNPGFRHCRWILYQLSRKGSLRILKWVAHPVSSRSSRPRNQTRVSCNTGGFFTNWAIRETCVEQRKVYFRAKQREWVGRVQKPPTSLKFFRQNWGGGAAGHVISFWLVGAAAACSVALVVSDSMRPHIRQPIIQDSGAQPEVLHLGGGLSAAELKGIYCYVYS